MPNNPFFDSINSILSSKKYWMETPYEERQYNPIGMNIAMSQHLDAVLYANEMNQFWQVLTPKMHYDYLFRTIRQMKRQFRKWAKKKEPDEAIAAIQEYYQINKIRAKEYLTLLSEKQLESIITALTKGTTNA